MFVSGSNESNILLYTPKIVTQATGYGLGTVRRFNRNPPVFVSDTEVIWKKQVFYTLTMNEDNFRCSIAHRKRCKTIQTEDNGF